MNYVKEIQNQTNEEWLAAYNRRDKMGLVAKNEGKDFKPASAGNHVSICYAVIDLGTQHKEAASGEWGSSEARDVKEILVMWEIPAEMVTYEKDGQEITRPQAISFFYTCSLNEKANLRKHLEAWRGKAFTQDELDGFRVDDIVGKPCMLNIVHKANGKAKITGVASMPKGIPVPAQTNDSLVFDLDAFNQDVFDKIPEGIQNIIKKSAEWQQNDFEPDNSFRKPVEDMTETSMDDDFENSDIPF